MLRRRLPFPEWTAREAAHAARVDTLVAGHVERRQTGAPHPVEDFLFVYYNNPPARLRRWHPGPGVVLEGAGGTARAQWRHYLTDDAGDVAMDAHGFIDDRGDTVAFVRELLTATLSRPAHTGCFGMHEWAMVYRLPAERLRHAAYPLRLGAADTDAVVEAHQVKCSHFDAFRFFTPEAAPRNSLQPQRDSQAALEQPGCLHAGMDLYKWSFKLAPLVPSELTLDAFELARDIRTLDMRASPYDLRDLGYEPIAIETPAGKAAYVAGQREFARRGNGLRQWLLKLLETVAGPGDTPA